MDSQPQLGDIMTTEQKQSAFQRWRGRKDRQEAASRDFWENLSLNLVDDEGGACLRPVPIPDSTAVVMALAQNTPEKLDAMLESILQQRISFDPFIDPDAGGEDSGDQADSIDRGGNDGGNAVKEFISQKPEILNVPPRSMVWDMAEAKMKEFATMPQRKVPLISIFIGFFLRLNGASDPALRQTIADMVKTNVAARSMAAGMGGLNLGPEPMNRG